MSESREHITRKDAMTIGMIGAALAAIVSYAFPENILEDMPLLFGFVIRIIFFMFCGWLYGYLRELPYDRWAAFERGMIAPFVISAMLFNAMPDKASLDKYLGSSTFVNVAYAETNNKKKIRSTSTIRQIIKGIIGK